VRARIHCANINHNAAARKAEPGWADELGTIDFADGTPPAHVAAALDGYVCAACTFVARETVAGRRARPARFPLPSDDPRSILLL
jgi:hypothetical protein